MFMIRQLFSAGRRSPAARLAAFALLAGLTCGGGGLLAQPSGPLPYRDDLSPEDRGRVAAVVAPTTGFSAAERFETMQAGATTSRKLVNRDAFSNFHDNLSFEEEESFKLGNALFRKVWVSAPASTQASDGLGPLFNARSCQQCHLKDGRGHPPAVAPQNTETGDAESMFLRLSIPPQTDADRRALAEKRLLRIPEPVYGGQLQDKGLPGIPPEGRMEIAYEEIPVELNGGEVAHLRKPTYRVSNPGYGPLHPQVMLSPRVAPQMIGLGLVEEIHPGDILALADPEDADGDGISGRPSFVRDPESGEIVLGRFGWKASTPTLMQQTSDAFSGDIGISSPPRPEGWGECTVAQTACRAAPDGIQPALGDSEAPDPVLDLVAFYSRNLAVPARRDVEDPQVLRGKKLFYAAGCTGCHVPKFVTRRDAAQKGHAFQLIWPYSDFLLHDMGDGLADGRPVGDASGREWRTAPLWGIGLTETVSDHTLFLHDGRARNLLEAILWHGGEAQAARDAVAAMPPADRADLLRFLESL